MLTSTHKLNFQTGRNTKKQISTGVDQKPQPEGHLPRITKMMALAIRLDHLIKSGQVADQAELARVGQVSRARLTQIMNLLSLAPDLQEEILFLPKHQKDREWLQEKLLRSIAGNSSWTKQRSYWETAKHRH
jgi:hypothetical protein